MRVNKQRFPVDKIDAYVTNNFIASYMSNAKWEKLIDNLTDQLEDGIEFNFKLIYSDKIESSFLNMTDCAPYFVEPILYKEVEWVEFPSEFLDYVSINNFKAGKKKYQQDLNKIESIISKTGNFELEITDTSIKLSAYKR